MKSFGILKDGKQNMGKTRIDCFDVAKGIAIISVIIGHLGIRQAYRFVFTYHLPLFFLITGYFISDKNSLREFAKKRLRSLMLPYAVTCFVIILLGTLKGFISGNALSEFQRWVFASLYGSGTVYQSPFYIPHIGAIWFLPATCVGAILLRITMKAPNHVRPFFIGALFMFGYLTSKYLFWFPMSIQAGFCFVFYMYIGWLYKRYESSIKAMGVEIKIVVSILAMIIWISFFIHYQGFYIVMNYLGRGIEDIIGTLCASAIVFMGSKFIDEKTSVIRRILIFAGRHSLLILCLHIVELNLFPWRGLFNRFTSISDQVYKGIMLFLKPSILLLATWIALRFRWIRRIFGYEMNN